MAKVYRAPIDPPVIDWAHIKDTDWGSIEQEYLEQLVAMAREGSPGDSLVGEVIRFGRGDGYAEYMVWRTKPLELIWIELGDAWSVEDALIRGLRLKDVENMVEADRRMREAFARRKEDQAQEG